MSGSGLTLSSGRYSTAGQFGASFDPAAAASAWYRPGNLVAADGTPLTTIPVVKGSSVPTPQVTQEPLLATSANGKRILTCLSDCVSLPLAAENNATAAWGLGLWLRPTDLVGGSSVFVVNTQGGGGSVARVTCSLTTGTTTANVQINVHATDGTTARRGITTNSPIAQNLWHFLYWDFLGAGANDAEKARLYINGALQTLTFAANPTEVAMPTQMLAATGFGWLFGTSGGGSPWKGQIGPDIWFFSQRLSALQRAQYQDYDIPTAA